MKVISASEAASLIEPGDSVLVSGSGGGHGVPEAILEAIEARFLETGSPRDLCLIHAVGIGDRKLRGAARFRHPGMLRRSITGALVDSPPLIELVQKDLIESYTLPQGVIAQLTREIAAGRPGLITKTGESLWQQVKRLLGPGHTGRKLAAVGLVAALAFAYFATDTYRVNADAQIEGSVRRAVISSYDGFIQEASARAGDVVKAGDELATLEDRELALERLRWATQRQQYSFEYDKALATRQPATINIVKSQIEQADAQLKLIDEQIARTRIVAPFDGLIVSGDLSQRIGGSVSRGELLYEIAPLTDYRVVMQVDERQIADVSEGQKGEVIFASLPDERFDLTIGKITPVAQARDGKNLFQVEGSLTQASPRLRPGMIGIAKIAIDRRRVVSIWMRPVLEWWRLASWRWMS